MKTEFFTAKISAEKNIQARRSLVALANHRIAFCIAIASTLSLASCVTPEMTSPHEAVIHALPWQPGDKGYYFDLENKDALVMEGIPASWFASTPRGFYLTALQEQQAGNIRAADHNKGVWVP